MDRLDPAFVNQQQQGIPGGSRSPTYEGRQSSLSLSKYVHGIISMPIDNQPGANPMTTPSVTVWWDAYKWVVGGLLTIIAVLLGLVYNDLRTDLGNVNTKFDTLTTKVDAKFDTLTKDVNNKFDTLTARMDQNHIELVREISNIAGKLELHPKDNHR